MLPEASHPATVAPTQPNGVSPTAPAKGSQSRSGAKRPGLHGPSLGDKDSERTETPNVGGRPGGKGGVAHPAVTATEALVTALIGIPSVAERREHTARALLEIARAEHREAEYLHALEAEIRPGYDAAEQLVADRIAA